MEGVGTHYTILPPTSPFPANISCSAASSSSHDDGRAVGGAGCEQLLESCYSATEQCIIEAGGALDDDVLLCKCLGACLGEQPSRSWHQTCATLFFCLINLATIWYVPLCYALTLSSLPPPGPLPSSPPYHRGNSLGDECKAEVASLCDVGAPQVDNYYQHQHHRHQQQHQGELELDLIGVATPSAAPRDADGVLAAILGFTTHAQTVGWFDTVYRKRWEHRQARRDGAAFAAHPADPLIAGSYLTPQSVQFDALTATLATLETEEALAWTTMLMPEGASMSKFRRQLVQSKSGGGGSAGSAGGAAAAASAAGGVQAWMNASGTSIIVRAERIPGSNCKESGGGEGSARSRGSSSGSSGIRGGGGGSDSGTAALALFDLRHHVDAAIGLPTTVHIYSNVRPGSQTFELHADHSDVLVVQLNGSKVWEVCSPNRLPPPHAHSESKTVLDGGLLAGAYQLYLKARWDDFTHTKILAIRARKQEQQEQQQQKAARAAAAGSTTPSSAVPFPYVVVGGGGVAGETALGARMWTHGRYYLTGGKDISVEGSLYDGADLAHFDCVNVTMESGDRLYMPFGVLHRAVTGEKGSTHMTLEWGKVGLTWSDLMSASVGWLDEIAAKGPTAATAATFDAVAVELQAAASVGARHAVRAAALLQEALRHDPGYFPGGECAPEMCEAPDALIPLTSKLVDPLPVWRLLDARGDGGARDTGTNGAGARRGVEQGHHERLVQARDALYREYVSIVTTVLKPHLVVTKRPLNEWVAEKTASLFGRSRGAGSGGGGSSGGGGGGTSGGGSGSGGGSSGGGGGGSSSDGSGDSSSGGGGDGGGGGGDDDDDERATTAAVAALVEELCTRSRFERGLDAVMRSRALKLEKERCP